MESGAKILADANLSDDDVIAIFVYGSHIYGTSGPDSDWDYIVVVKDAYFASLNLPQTEEPQLRLEHPARDITLFSESNFKRGLVAHDIKLLECILCPAEYKLLERVDFSSQLEFSPETLRSAVSAKCDHSWTKAMKKLTVEKDFAPLIAKKSLFHSFRMNQFAIDLVQSASTGRPAIRFDNPELKQLYREIVFDESNDWEHFKTKFKTRYNNAKSALRQLVPKKSTK